MKQKQILELEKQLSCPSGELGIKIGENMNKSNKGMTLNSIQFLEIKNKNSVLEIGHGNCGHLDDLLKSAEKIKYFGLEISEIMMKEAQKNNLTQKGIFRLYDGELIPYLDQLFDRIFSVNTIYFWSDPEKLMKEIERTLKQDGICVLTYANKDFMKNLSFVGLKFNLYDQNDLEKLVEKSNLKIVESKELTEQVKSKTGEEVNRKYTMTKLKKATANSL